MSTERSPARRVVVCGLDGATWTLLRPLMDEGVMPNLRRIVGEGASGDLRSTLPPVTAPAWTTCLTGVNPGKHGVFGFFARDPETLRRRYMSAASIRVPPLWRRLGEAGRTVGLVNVPVTYPPEAVNGYMVTGFLTPPGRPYTFPEALQPELEGSGYRISATPRKGRLPDPVARRWLAEVYDVVQARTEAALKLQQRHEPDWSMVVYMAPDLLQHVFYKLLDPAEELYDSPESEALRPLLHRCYAAMDEALGAYRGSLGPDDLLLVCSDHGFTGLRGRFYLNRWLAGEGWLKLRRAALVSYEVSRQARTRLARLLPATRERSGGLLGFDETFVDRRRSAALGGGPAEFALHLLRPEAPRDELVAGLTAVRDADGEAVVEAVVRREDCYDGPHVSEAPHLLLRTHQDRWVFANRLWSRRPGVLRRVRTAAGTHHRDGILAAVGGPVAAGVRLAAGLEDVTPTVLYALGETVPEGLDGRPLLELFRSEVAEAHPPRHGGDLGAAGAHDPYSGEDEDEIASRLADLGYIE